MQEYCTLEPVSRKLTLTEPQRIAGVESDENVRGLKFKFPKIIEGTDFTQMQLRINFMNSRQKKGQYIVTDLKPMDGEEDYITFTWPFSRLVTRYRGYTKFVICAVKTDENGTITAEWNTALAQMRVLEGLEVEDPEISPEEKDVIAQLIAICETAVAESAASAQQAKEEADKVFKYGPAIGPDGNWLIGGVNTGKPSRGITPDFQIGTVTTLPPDSEATANITGEPEKPFLNLGIPKGKDGGSDTWEKIAEITITEPVTEASVTFGKEVGDVFIFSSQNIEISEETNGAFYYKFNDGNKVNPNLSFKNRGGFALISDWKGYRADQVGTSGFKAYIGARGDFNTLIITEKPEKVSKFTIANSFGGQFASGKFVIYGRN